jgi:hypothetical protein
MSSTTVTTVRLVMAIPPPRKDGSVHALNLYGRGALLFTVHLSI